MSKAQKIILVFLTALTAVFLYLKPIYAKSGCCSHHGGVNCAAGPQSNGKVICNDSWRGSSCYYSEMVKCGGYTAPEPEQQIEAPPPAVVAPPEPSPSPTVIKPSPSFITKPSPSPKPKLSPSLSPSQSPSPSPKPTPKPPPSNESNPSPEVKGEKTESASTAEAVGSLGIMGALGWGGYKLLKKFITKGGKVEK